MFPIETVEKILSYCDGRTLINARNVNETWKRCVDYLTKKTKIWKYCCIEEIPESQLIEYVEKFCGDATDAHTYYMEIYYNWMSWQNIKDNVDFDIIVSPADVPRITCLAVSGRYIAVGSEDGRIRIFNDSWDSLYTDRFLSVRVTGITFMHENEGISFKDPKPFVIISYRSGNLYLVNYGDRNEEPLTVQDVKLSSVYKKYLCLVKSGGRISVVKLIKETDGTKRFFEITYVRIYSPMEVTGVTMWKGVCTFLMNSDVKTLLYDPQMQSITSVENKTRLKFLMKNSDRSSQIYRNDIVISLSSPQLNEQFIELFILGKKERFSKKIFNSWDVLQSYITCMFLYGNTFIVGVDIGIIYVYNIDSWKSFDIRKHDERIIIGKHPIVSIDVKETKGERKFYIASSFNIHEVVGFTVVNLRQ